MAATFSEAAVGVDWSGRIQVCNAAAGRLLGREPKLLLGQPLVTIIPERLREPHSEAFSRFVVSGERRLRGTKTARLPALRGDGSEIEVEVRLDIPAVQHAGELAAMAVLNPVDDPVTVASHPVLSRFLRAVVDASYEGVLAVSKDRRVIAVNRRFHQLWNLPPGSIQVGDSSPALGHPQLSQIADPAAFEAAIKWGHEHPYQGQSLEVALRDGRIIEGYASPILDSDGAYLGRIWHLHDETERRAEREHRDALLKQLEAAERVQGFLLEASAVLASASGFADTLEALARVAVPTLGDLCLIDITDETGAIVRMAAAHADPDLQPLADRLRGYPPDPAGAHPSVEVIRRGRSSWSATMTEEFLAATTRDREHLELLRALRFNSYVAVPLVADGRVLGGVTLVASGSGRRFGPRDVFQAENLASRVALVVAKESRYERERSTSHELQASLLPSTAPSVPGVEMAVRYLPGTRDAEVGGDFWDVVVMPTGEVAVAVGDVAGHDITAAATMAQLRSACRALRAQSTGPAELVRLVQDSWEHLALERIATAIFARLQPATGRLRICSAGHPPPLIVDDGQVGFLPVEPAPPFGAPPRQPANFETTVAPGTALVFFTDGLVEERTRSLADGLDRLKSAAKCAPSLDPDRLADHILSTVSGNERVDDVALVAIRVT